MTYDLFLGVDPGKKGAWALLKADGTLLAVEPLPYLGDRIDVLALDEAWADAWRPHLITAAANIEYPMAVQGQSGGEKTFINFGILISAATRVGAPLHLPRPHIWKGKLNLSKDKTASVRMALDLWPAWREKFVGPRGGGLDGMAESALIAEHLRRANLRIRTPERPEWLPEVEGFKRPAMATGRFAGGNWVE